MTEDEAKAKPCIGPVPYNTGAPANPAADGTFIYVCVGGACMAWRESPWSDTRRRELWSKKKGTKVSSAVGTDAEWRLVDPDEPLPPKHGYCAWAGCR